MPANSIAINEGPNFTGLSGEALGQFLRVKRNASGDLVLCGILDTGVGVTLKAVATATRVPCRYANAQGSQIGIASEAIAIGDIVYSAASGKVSKTSAGAVKIGRATSAAALNEQVAFEAEAGD